MSLIHHIITKRPLDVAKLTNFVSNISNAMCENRGEGTYYFWIEGKSTRGFDITIDGDDIEVRNTILSSAADYELTNKIVQQIKTLTDGIILDEADEQVKLLPLFDHKRISEAELKDCALIQTLSKLHEDIAIYGPIRKVHFGKRLHEAFNFYSGQELKEKMFDLILTVNYTLP